MNMMGMLFETAVKVSLVILTATLTARLCRDKSASVRHWIWAVAAISAVLLPVLSAILPSYDTPVARPVAITAAVALAGQPAHQAPGVPMLIDAALQAARNTNVAWSLFWLWAAGGVFGLVYLLAGFARLAWLARRSELLLSSEWMKAAAVIAAQLQLDRPPRLLLASQSTMPMTWGVFRPIVLLPSDALDWDAERIRLVLSHELAHVKRGDWLVQILAECGRALHWFNPLVWICCGRLKLESERACDDAVLLSGIAGPAYAEHLLHFARTLRSSDRAWSAALAMARTSQLERRFTSMLNPNLDRARLSRTAGVLTSVFAACLLIPLASIHAPGQNLSGKLSGTVVDATGGAIPNATIIVSNAEARTKDMTTSDPAGRFEFAGLNAGQYSLEVLKPGFARYTSPLRLEANHGQHVPITLQLGTITERMDVIGEGASKTAATPERVKMGGDIQAAKIVKMVRPAYPPAAKSAGIEGAVLLEAVISKEGEPLSLRVMNSQVDADLAKSAVESVSQWRYSPTLLNGEPVEVITQITVNFKLQ